MSGSLTSSSSEAKALQHRVGYRHLLKLLGAGLGWLILSRSGVVLSQTTGTLRSEATGQAAAETLTRPTLKPGSRGAQVTELQATLKLLGYYSGSVDGVYGQSTVSAVSQFQQAAGLNADGITGPATWNRLFPSNAEGSTASVTTPNRTMPSTSPPPSATASNSAASFPVPAGVSTSAGNETTPATGQPAAPNRPTTSSTSTRKPAKPTSNPPATETRPTATSQPVTQSGAEPVGLPVLKQGIRGPAVTALQERLRAIGLFKGVADGVFGRATLAAVQAAQRRFKLDPDGVVGPATWSVLLR